MPIPWSRKLEWHSKLLIQIPEFWGMEGHRHWCVKGYCEWQEASESHPRQHIYHPPHWDRPLDESLQPTDGSSIKQIKMRKLEEEIENKLLADKYLIILQRLPPAIWYQEKRHLRTKGHQYKTTCGYPYCPEKNNVSQPGSFRVSIEPRKNFTLDYLPRMPQKSTSIGISDQESVTEFGRGEQDTTWFCLKCFENLWDGVHVVAFPDEGPDDEILAQEREYRRDKLNSRFTMASPANLRPELKVPSLYKDLVSSLRAEDRDHRPNTGYYALSQVEEKAFAKWKAVHCHAFIRDNKKNRELVGYWSFPDPEPNRFYEDENGVGEAYMGEWEENLKAAMTVGSKRIIELDPAELKGRKLGYAMDLVAAELKKFLEEDGWEDPGPVVEKGQKALDRTTRRFGTLMSAHGDEDGDSDEEGAGGKKKQKMVFTLPRLDSRPPTPGTLEAEK